MREATIVQVDNATAVDPPKPGDPWVRWVDPDGTRWEGRGAQWIVTAPNLPTLAAEVKTRLSAMDGNVAVRPRVFVGSAFDSTRDHGEDPAWRGFPRCWAMLPAMTSVARAGHLPSTAEGAPRTLPSGGDEAAWRKLVEKSLQAFAARTLDKVVGARRVSRPWSGDLPRLLASLDASARASEGVSFALCPGGEAGVFVGATPERLVSREGIRVEADALAGSLPRRGLGADEATKRRLLASEKDLREHLFVRDDLVRTLEAFCEKVAFEATPRVRSLPNVHHLYTPMLGWLREGDDTNVIALAAAVHPTPAVCGTPQSVARDWIRAHERAPRGWYAGPVGWCDARGDGVFMVALRSGVVTRETAWLYAGAGLVAGSDAAHEWAETEAKLQILLRAIGAAG